MTNLLKTGTGGVGGGGRATSSFSQVPKTKISAKGAGASLAALPQNTKIALAVGGAAVALLAIALPVIFGSGSSDQAQADNAADEASQEAGLGLLPESLSADFETIESGSNAGNQANSASANANQGSAGRSSSSSPPSSSSGGSSARETATVHTLKDGETLSHVAREYYGASSRWRIIAEANGLSEAQARQLRAGTELKIPAADDFRGSRNTPSASASNNTPSANSPEVPRSDRGLINPSSPAAETDLAGATSTRRVERTVFPGGTHTLRDGDSHFRLASRYYGPEHLMEAQRIRQANPHVDWSDFEPGIRVRIPKLTIEVEETIPSRAPRSESRSAPSSGGRTYTVADGDTLSGIARQHYGSAAPQYVRKIQDANGIRDPTQIRPGQELRIPR